MLQKIVMADSDLSWSTHIRYLWYQNFKILDRNWYRIVNYF